MNQAPTDLKLSGLHLAFLGTFNIPLIKQGLKRIAL